MKQYSFLLEGKNPKDINIDLIFSNKNVGSALLRFYDDGDVFLTNFIIDKKYRDKGYGQKAIQYLITKYKMNCLTVGVNNQEALHIYKKFGFKQVGKQYYDKNGNEIVYYMRRDK